MTLLFAAVAVAGVLSSVGGVAIDHDKVQPFAQPEPVTESEKIAVKHKPSLQITAGCHPYPAVNAAGETSAGLKGTGKANGECTGSALGSQVYGRATWYKEMWAIMYAWYFPKDKGFGLFVKGYRHKWAAAVVWLNDTSLEASKILAVSVITIDGVFLTKKNVPPICGRRFCAPSFDEYIDGTSPILEYQRGYVSNGLAMTTARGQGELQDLIMWEQLTDEARTALTDADFAAPFIDEAFEPNLESALPIF